MEEHILLYFKVTKYLFHRIILTWYNNKLFQEKQSNKISMLQKAIAILFVFYESQNIKITMRSSHFHL